MLTDSLAADGQTTMTGAVNAYPGSAAAPSYTWGSSPTDGFYLSGTHQIGLAIAGALAGFFNANGFNTTAGKPTGTPVGAIQDFAGSTAPAGWYLCFGQAVSRTTYATLFGIVGTTYGAGDGLTTFNLPDCRGRATFGQDNMGGSAANRITVAGGNFDGTVLGGSGGQQNQTLSTAQLPAHGHDVSPVSVNVTDPGHVHAVTDPGHSHTVASGNAGAGSSPSVVAANATGVTNNNPATSTATTGISVNSHATGITAAITGNSANTGSGSSHPVLSNAIIFNKIIFAGA
jgi:microcystin-dependent protein